MVRSLPDLALRLDSDGRILEVLAKGRLPEGLAAELTGSDLKAHLLPDALPEVDAALQIALEADVPATLMVEMQIGENVYDCELRISPLRGESYWPCCVT